MDRFIQMGQVLGYEGQYLQDFVNQQQAEERAERKAENDEKEKDRATELARLAEKEKDREIELAKIGWKNLRKGLGSQITKLRSRQIRKQKWRESKV